MLLHCYYFSGCQSCSMQKQCTTGKERRVKRWEHEAVIDAMQARLEHDPGKMKVRRQTVEHPFGTLKYWMGAGSREPGAGDAGVGGLVQPPTAAGPIGNMPQAEAVAFYYRQLTESAQAALLIPKSIRKNAGVLTSSD